MRLATLGGLRLPNHSVRLMAGVLGESGFDVTAAMEKAGISPALVDDPAGEVTGLQELAFQRVFCALTEGQPLLWVELGMRYHMLSHAHSFYGLALATSHDVQAAVEQGLRFADLWYTLAEGSGLYEGGRLAGVRTLTSEVPADLKRFTVIRDLATNHRVFNELWNGPFPFDRVEAPLSRADEPLVRDLYPDVPITYEASCCAWYWSVDLRSKQLAQSDAILNRAYSERCLRLISEARDADDPIHRVSALLESCRGQLSLEEAADKVGQSPRTIQRHLHQQGLSFRELAAMARYRAACRLLTETATPITQIAVDVGYENVSSFNYAFRRYAGMSPRSYRRRGPAGDKPATASPPRSRADLPSNARA